MLTTVQYYLSVAGGVDISMLVVRALSLSLQTLTVAQAIAIVRRRPSELC